MPKLCEEAERRGDPASAYGLAEEAADVVADLDYHSHCAPDLDTAPTKPARRVLWYHVLDRLIVAPKGGFDAQSIDKQAYEHTVSQYLARPWMQHDYIDWCIVDTLVVAEWSAYLWHVRGQRSARRFLGVFQAPIVAAVYLLPLWGVWYLVSSGSDWGLPAAGLYAAWVAWELVSLVRRQRGKGRDRVPSEQGLLRAMHAAYTTLDGPVLSPTRVRDALKAADAEGVAWPQAIWPVLDTVVARNPAVWRVAPGA